DGERAIAAHRAALRARDEAAEDERRLAALIERRHAAPDDGPNAGRRAQLTAELAAERATFARAERERAARRRMSERATTARQRVNDVEHELQELASRLELEAAPASEGLGEDERDALRTRIERLARRREQLGPVNPLAQQEYAEALEHVEDLERQRSDLETAL